jgi:hypothetical protein
MTRALAIHATKNSRRKDGTIKPDATGAFIIEAKDFADHYACYREGFDNELPDALRRKRVEDILRKYRDLELIAFFCHGYRRGLQTEHDLQTVNALADAIAVASGPNIVVALYACSTAHALTVKRGGFADALRDALTARGKTGHVDAHTTAAHSVWNPMLQRFDMGDPVEEIVGDWLVRPRLKNPERKTNRKAPPTLPADPEWKAWTKRLKAKNDPFCFRFPLMTADAIRAALR